jgi:hypothetical protein
MSEGPNKPEEKKPEIKVPQGRSPAYPYLPLAAAVELAAKLHAAGAKRTALPPETLYQIWKMGSQSSGARQSLAALNHFGLVDYIGRGDDRKVKLSDLALKIVLDKQPESPERDVAIREAALKPPIHAELYERYQSFLPSDVVLETFLTRDMGYNPQGAKSLIGEYRATLEFAKLDKPDNEPSLQRANDENFPQAPVTPNTPSQAPERTQPAITDGLAMPPTSGENDIKILLDGERLRVSAFVDLKGAKRLVKALKANIALLEDEENDDDEM